MAEASDSIRQNIEQTRSTLDEKLDRLETKVRETVDVRRRVSEHPWMVVAAAVAAGYVVGSLGDGAGHNGDQAPASSPMRVRRGGGVGLLQYAAALAIADIVRGVLQEQFPAVARYLGQPTDRPTRPAAADVEAPSAAAPNRSGDGAPASPHPSLGSR